MTELKTALVLEWPSVDASGGGVLSEWEQQTTKELLDLAGLKPTRAFVAYPRYVRKWPELFASGKPYGPLRPDAEDARLELVEKLKGYDIALTMGAHAMFALTGQTKLETFRGTHIDSPYVEGLQVVPTYAPYIYSKLNWSERPVVVSAMRKACKRFEDRPATIYLPECLADLEAFEAEHIKNEIIFDVETNRGCRITEFGLAPNSSTCLYVQLETRAHESVWSPADELGIWLWLHKLSLRKDLTWVAHNATYDLTYLDAYGIRPQGPVADTMLRYHGWQPELEKSLGFLASVHVPTRAWKQLRTQAANAYNKAGAL